jgi:hypothetical protein
LPAGREELRSSISVVSGRRRRAEAWPPEGEAAGGQGAAGDGGGAEQERRVVWRWRRATEHQAQVNSNPRQPCAVRSPLYPRLRSECANTKTISLQSATPQSVPIRQNRAPTSAQARKNGLLPRRLPCLGTPPRRCPPPRRSCPLQGRLRE